MWMSLAAAGASGDLKEDSLSGLNRVAGEMTPEQILEAERLANEWKPRTDPASTDERYRPW